MTTTLTKPDQKTLILQNMPRGHENAITGENLAIKCGCWHYKGDTNEVVAETRGIRLTIEELIEEEHEICSSPHSPYGYYFAATPQEVSEALRVLKYGYGKKLYRHYRALLKAGQKAFPQQIDVPHGQLKLNLFNEKS